MSKNVELFRDYFCKYKNIYVFVQEDSKTISFKGNGQKSDFDDKYWNYEVKSHNDNPSDKTTTVILCKCKGLEII